MAKYCRYCKTRMTDPKDRFCYKCRREGEGVGYLFRYAKKNGLSPQEQDLICASGADLIVCGLVQCVFPIFFLALAAALDNTADQFSPVLIVLLIVFLLFSLYLTVTGALMSVMSKWAVNRKFKIGIIRGYYTFLYYLRVAKTSGLAALTKQKAMIGALTTALNHLAEGYVFEEEESAGAGQGTGKVWKCSFCGYENRNAGFACKSCGEIRK